MMSSVHVYGKDKVIDVVDSFIYPTDAQLDCSKNVKIYVKIYMRGAPTCFGFFTHIIRELLYVLC